MQAPAAVVARLERADDLKNRLDAIDSQIALLAATRAVIAEDLMTARFELHFGPRVLNEPLSRRHRRPWIIRRRKDER